MLPLDHIAVLAAEGPLLADAAESAGLDRDVPPCPGWTVRDLLRHVGEVHRWATAIVAGRLPRPPDEQRLRELAEPPADPGLVRWFTEGHDTLVRALSDAGDGLDCWSFLPAPSPRAFWARRQAHETCIHRQDVQAAAGRVGPAEPELAADGIDELLTGFFARPRGRLLAEPPVTLGVTATDAGRDWTMWIGPDRREVVRTRSEAATCTVTGPASDLYRLLWNRDHAPSLTVEGDPAVLRLWRERARVTWG